MRPLASGRGARRSDGIEGPAQCDLAPAVSLNAQEWRRAPHPVRKRATVGSEWKGGAVEMGQASPASLGIDVAKATFEAALLVDGMMLQRSFAMTVAGFDALHTGMSKQGVERVHVCLEAPGAYGAA